MSDTIRRIHLVRHGESTWNAVRRVQGNHGEVDLSELGRAQARLLGERLRGIEFARVFCSSVERAVQPARLALGEDHSIEFMDDLREISFGAWEGMLVSEVEERYPGELELWFRSPSKVTIEGAEPFGEFHERAGRTVDGIIDDTEGDVLIISHGGIICAWLTHVLGMSPDDIWSFSLPNTSLTTVMIDFRPRLRLLGDVSHLDGKTLGFDGMPAPVRK
ncbi:MAG: histidine phosphatase family protein [Candidatus Krumholzibacteria bacterium]|nr:histidine phosphatase family protein [Candidatus Krumholzibacteria bacterium]